MFIEHLREVDITQKPQTLRLEWVLSARLVVLCFLTSKLVVHKPTSPSDLACRSEGSDLEGALS